MAPTATPPKLDPETRVVTRIVQPAGLERYQRLGKRGQAWAMLGYTHAYEARREQRIT